MLLSENIELLLAQIIFFVERGVRSHPTTHPHSDGHDMCAMCIEFASVSKIFRLNFGIVLTVWYFMLFIGTYSEPEVTNILQSLISLLSISILVK